jgi:hypothetical protein
MRFRFHSLALAVMAARARKQDAQMAVPADVNIDVGGYYANDAVRVQLNNAIAALRIICAKLDLDAGVTDVNYTALALDAAVATAPAKVRP